MVPQMIIIFYYYYLHGGDGNGFDVPTRVVDVVVVVEEIVDRLGK